MNFNNLAVTDTLTENKDYTISLFDRNTVRIETGDEEIFLDAEDIQTAADKIDDTSYATLTELDRRVLGKIITRKNERYAELAKLHLIDSHSGDYISIIHAIEREEDTELSPQEILNRLNEIVDRTITSLEEQITDTGWPQKLQER
jgi:hypothetical protein